MSGMGNAFLAEDVAGGISIKIYVQPRSSRTRITGIHDGQLRLALTAPPVEGQANAQVIAFLAKIFRVPKKAVSLQSGEQGRTKRVTGAGVPLAEADRCLAPLIPGKENIRRD